MGNTEEKLAEEPSEESTEKTEIELAGIPPRVLSAVVDYFVIRAFVSVFSRVQPVSDFAVLITLLIAALYFGLGNSKLLNGQTLGKRMLGLQVVSNNGLDAAGPISFGRSLMRFFGGYGVIIVLSELPNLIYRQQAFVASPFVLELHMLLVLGFLLITCCSALLDRRHRAVHDRWLGTVVLRSSATYSDDERAEVLERLNATHDESTGTPLLKNPLLWGSVLAIVLWLPGVTHLPEVEILQRNRFLLENRFPLRIGSMQMQNTSLEISGIIVEQGPDVSSDRPELETLMQNVLAFLEEQQIAWTGRTTELKFSIYDLRGGVEPELKEFSYSKEPQ